MKTCPACISRGRTCALCESGLLPAPGLNPELITTLAEFLQIGSCEAGRRPEETVLGHAARLVRERARETLVDVELNAAPNHPDADFSEVTVVSLSTKQTEALSIARTVGIVSVLDSDVTSDTLDELYDRGLLDIVSMLDGKIMSARPRAPWRPTERLHLATPTPPITPGLSR